MKIVSATSFIGDAALYFGDAENVINDIKKADCLITDPPYGLDAPAGTISKERSHKRDYDGYDDTHANLTNKIIPIVKAALDICGGRGIVTSGGKHAFDYPKPAVLGGFYQPAACGMCAWGRLTMQPVLFYGRDPKLGKTIQPITYVLTEKASDDRHPCSKPMGAAKWLIERGSVEGDTILDPFMGSGTFGVAALALGRKYIGIELNQDYFNIARERIKNEYNQIKMF
jgi:DNA modification methylase